LSNGKYLRPQFLGELDRLRTELETVRPNLVITLGATAAWAVLGSSSIRAIRGTITQSHFTQSKILPTFHPSYILRNWAERPILQADLLKAAREGQFPEIRRPQRWVTVDPTLDEIEQWFNRHGASARILAVDIETKARQITEVGFAASREFALVIPFWKYHGDHSYWPSASAERAAWEWVQRLLALPCPKLFQNGLYDLQYLLRMGLRPANCLHDTMLLHHSMYPELQKGLGFLGSIYTNEAAWKLMNSAKAKEQTKKDE